MTPQLIGQADARCVLDPPLLPGWQPEDHAAMLLRDCGTKRLAYATAAFMACFGEKVCTPAEYWKWERLAIWMQEEGWGRQ